MPIDIETSGSGRISLLAPAKVNLFLHITGRRANGFHELESLFVRTDFGDQITVEHADGLSLAITGPYADPLKEFSLESNLVMQAAAAMLKHHGKMAGAKITLEKNLPLASGIGGGSADAAATLLALKALWNVEIPDKKLLSIALGLGADVPACLGIHPQWVKGIGEHCEDVSLGFDPAILLVNPRTSVSTPDVFKAFKVSSAPFTPLLDDKSIILSSIKALANSTVNDLYRPARTISPVIGEVIELLINLPKQRMVRMSGSGATCFALFNSLLDAENASKLIEDKKPEWWVASGSVMR